MIFTLTGFMGCGKSTIGRELSRQCGFEFADTDSYICKQMNMSIPEIFRRHSESGFRQIEYECLKRLLLEYSDTNAIISLGGGTVTYGPSETLVAEKTFGIYLCCPIDELVENLMIDGVTERPMFDGHEDIRSRVTELMEKRDGIYRRCTKLCVHPYSLTSDYLLSRLDINDA